MFEFPASPIPAANVASVPQRSPLRYPGGKTWLIPHIRAWLGAMDPGPRLLIEPFAGGAIVSLTAVMEDLVERCLLAELDRDVAAFWEAALYQGPELCEMIREFTLTRPQVEALEREQPDNPLQRGFRTLVLNRTRRGGILAPGAALISGGEYGRGVSSRWYPQTLAARVSEIYRYARDCRIKFHPGDGMQLLERETRDSESVIFADPPYTAGGKRAGERLYVHHSIDHEKLFEMLADTTADFMLTYDHTNEIETLVHQYNFHAVKVATRNTHHAIVSELVITRRAI